MLEFRPIVVPEVRIENEIWKKATQGKMPACSLSYSHD